MYTNYDKRLANKNKILLKLGGNMKKVFILFIFVLLIICNTDSVFAANLCTKEKYNDLKEKASNVEIEWELKYDENDNFYFKVNANNVDDDLILFFDNLYYEPKDGNIEVLTFLEGGNTYQFKFYGGYNHPCVEEYIYTRNLTIPKYNKYSELEVCSEYSEWELCDKWYSGEIKDTEDFYNKLEEYKKKLASGEIVIEKDNNKLYYSFGIIIIIIIIAILFLLFYKKKKKR